MSQTESNHQSFIHSMQHCEQETKKRGWLPSASFSPHIMAPGECQVEGAQMEDALNKRLLPLYGVVGQGDTREGLEIERYSVKVETTASTTATNKEASEQKRPSRNVEMQF